ncbi:MAG: hypothetical protein ACI4O0_04645 [Candidatus Limivicinus sp.]
MKTKPFVSTLLALLLICSLPVSAFAGTVEDNPAGTTVLEIPAGDTMTNNNEDAIVYTNKGTVTNNNGTVVSNSKNGTVTNNNEGAIVDTNNGTVFNNVGTVTDNAGTVKTNNGKVEHNVDNVQTNNGTVEHNNGTVETNTTTGTVQNVVNGKVTTNYGTVIDKNGKTWYGVQVDNDGTDIGKQYCEPDEVLDFSQLTKEGYVYAGYIQEYQLLDGVLTKQALTVNDTSYTVTCPNVLTLIWQAIVIPGSGEIAAAVSDGTGSFGPGSVISINGYKFLLVAVVEDVYCLASVDSFEEEQLSDLPALLSSLLTEEQLSHVTGEPELLDEALTARFFAGQGSHIVFPCDSGLIFS